MEIDKRVARATDTILKAFNLKESEIDADLLAEIKRIFKDAFDDGLSEDCASGRVLFSKVKKKLKKPQKN